MERKNPLPFMENSIKSFHFVFRNPSLRWSDFKYSIQLHWIHSYFNVIGKLMINNLKKKVSYKNPKSQLFLATSYL